MITYVDSVISPYLSEWRSDYARLLHSLSFRRLQGKTQLFPCLESDFFRNRLTHSLEVAQIAKTIAIKINNEHLSKKGEDFLIDLDLIEVAGLAHDIGHPPFGHQGEEALDECMLNYGGFEGNAQTLRLLSRIEKKIQKGELALGGFDKNGNDKRAGLNLTYRTLASIIKYDECIPLSGGKSQGFKGYYIVDTELVNKIKKHVVGNQQLKNPFKTIECQIMDIADDLAYSTYDLEDAFKAGFMTPFDLLFANSNFYKKVGKSLSVSLGRNYNQQEIQDILNRVFYFLFDFKEIKQFDVKKNSESVVQVSAQFAHSLSQAITNNNYSRSIFTANLINRFISGIKFEFDPQIPALSRVYLDTETQEIVEVFKQVAFESQILSPKLRIAAYRGKEIVKKIYDTLISNSGYELLPDDFRILYEVNKNDEYNRRRIICDYIACMTDKYAIEFYGRIVSENSETIFKPH